MIWPEPTAFLLSRCGKCAHRQRLTLNNGQIARLCLVDGKSILPDITSCNRTIPKPRAARKPAT